MTMNWGGNAPKTNYSFITDPEKPNDEVLMANYICIDLYRKRVFGVCE